MRGHAFFRVVWSFIDSRMLKATLVTLFRHSPHPIHFPAGRFDLPLFFLGVLACLKPGK